MTIRSVRGAKDLLPKDYDLFQKIIRSAEKIASTYGFQGFATPIMEYTEVFDRTLGDTSDVVNKEMYSFIDRSGDSITLRPEFTAGVMRSVISEGLTHSLPLRLFSYGPVFRHDRPQAGRQRQFHQLNFEFIGEKAGIVDAEAVKLGYDIIKDLGIDSDIVIEINSLGCSQTRELYHVKLKEYLLKYETELSEDSKKRLHKNPMRILDSKDENDKKILTTAPEISEFYTKESKDIFETTLKLLEDSSVPFEVNKKLVRGLDYYCHTAFEYSTKKIGAQTAVGGGGRYDGLASIMSKHDIPAIGLACGIERFMILLEKNNLYSNSFIAIFPMDDLLSESLKVADILRKNNLPVRIFEYGKIGKRIEKSVSLGAKFAIFLGANELNLGEFKIKNLDTAEEYILPIDNLVNFLKVIKE